MKLVNGNSKDRYNLSENQIGPAWGKAESFATGPMGVIDEVWDY
jgi:hypothetical protein